MLYNKQGQMSMMFIVAIAIALVFLALTMNWNRTAQIKTQSQVAATTAAGVLVSRMASYGHNQMMTQLGGKREKCAKTGLLGAILMVIFIIIVIIVSCVYGACSGGALATQLMNGLFISLALAVVNVVVQAAIIQPAITRMWNKLQKNITTVEDQFLENALQTSLFTIATDTEMMPDVLDYDMDGRWNVPNVLGRSNDEVSRLTYHYTRRLMNVKRPQLKYSEFQAELTKLVEALGMKIETSCCLPGDNFCNPDCAYSESKGDVPAVASLCQLTPFQDYPFSYDPLLCQRVNKPNSLVGLLGRDDSNLYFRKDAAFDPRSTETTFMAAPGFIVEDSDGPIFRLLWQLLNISTDKPKVGAGLRQVITDVATLNELVKPANPPDQCPGNPPQTGIWRQGNDFFCSRNFDGVNYTAPHYAGCSQHDSACNNMNDSIGAQCDCALSSDKAAWHNDMFDEHWMSLREFAQKADLIVNDSQNLLTSGLDQIKDEITMGIGLLTVIQADFTNWRDFITSWYSNLYHTHTSLTFSGTAYEVFCGGNTLVNEAGGAPLLTLQSVINCDKFYAFQAEPLFKQCLNDCDQWNLTCTTAKKQCVNDTAACNGCLACSCPASPPGAPPCPCPPCGGVCGAAAASCAFATLFCSTPGNVPSCVNRPRSLADDGLLFDTLAVDCHAGSNFRTRLTASVTQAAVAAPFFEDRVPLLEAAQVSAGNLLPKLSAALIEGFANLPAVQVKAVEATDEVQENKLESSVIYGWQGKSGAGGLRGRVHLVKLEADLPKRCDAWSAENGGLPAACGTSKFPWIKTAKKGLFKRCYTLTDTDGCVRVRVSRFDENASGTVGFASGITRLWQFFGQHPNASDADALVKQVRLKCFGYDHIMMEDGTILYTVPDSFMISRTVDSALSSADYTQECRAAAAELIQKGFVTETCAKYYLDGNQYKMKFVSCGKAACSSK